MTSLMTLIEQIGQTIQDDGLSVSKLEAPIYVGRIIDQSAYRAALCLQ